MNSRNLTLSHTKLGSDFFLRNFIRKHLIYQRNLPFVQFRQPMFTSLKIKGSPLHSVLYVPRVITPLQILYSIIRSIAVDMVHLGEIARVRDVGFGYQTVYQHVFPFLVDTQYNPKIALPKYTESQREISRMSSLSSTGERPYFAFPGNTIKPFVPLYRLHTS